MIADWTDADDRDVDYLLAELSWLDTMLRHHLAAWREQNQSELSEEFRGLYVSDAEVDRLLDGDGRWLDSDSRSDASGGSRDGSVSGHETTVGEQLETRTRALREHRLRHTADGSRQRLRFVELGERFGLDRAHLDVLLVGLAPALDPKYERIYAYLQDDVTKRLPTVDLTCRILGSTPTGRLAARRLFAPSSPLVRHRLVRVSPVDGTPLGSRTLSVDDRIVAYLTGSDDPAAELADVVTVTRPTPETGSTLDTLGLEASVGRTLERIVERNRSRDSSTSSREPSLLTHLYGPYGAGTTTAVDAICAETARPLVSVHAGALVEDIHETVPLLTREARLQGRRTAIHVGGVPLSVDGYGAPTPRDREGGGSDARGATAAADGATTALVRALDRFDGPLFLTGRAPLPPRRWRSVEAHECLTVAFPRPTYDTRKRLWTRIERELPDSVDVDPADLATKFRLTPGQIDDALATAEREAGAAGRPLDAAAVYAACRALSRGTFGSLAQAVNPTYDWDDIVLPETNTRHLREVAAQIRHRGTVYADWGFEERFTLGKGLLVLFTGTSGTGKTMAAEVIANEAELDLFKVDLSQIVDKYVGETEKNLGRVFDGAAGSDAILLFDEADALFGKRSEVRDARDRYANVEVNYLLQRVEEHDGTVILTTNLRKNMDEAFLRRIHLRVDFPFPDEPARKAIWEAIFPAETPVADLDIEFLSTLSLAGGSIKNAALTAAFLAADDGGIVEMSHVVRAVQREFQKAGTLVEPEAFGDYRDLLGGRARERTGGDTGTGRSRTGDEDTTATSNS